MRAFWLLALLVLAALASARHAGVTKLHKAQQRITANKRRLPQSSPLDEPRFAEDAVREACPKTAWGLFGKHPHTQWEGLEAWFISQSNKIDHYSCAALYKLVNDAHTQYLAKPLQIGDNNNKAVALAEGIKRRSKEIAAVWQLLTDCVHPSGAHVCNLAGGDRLAIAKACGYVPNNAVGLPNAGTNSIAATNWVNDLANPTACVTANCGVDCMGCMTFQCLHPFRAALFTQIARNLNMKSARDAIEAAYKCNQHPQSYQSGFNPEGDILVV